MTERIDRDGRFTMRVNPSEREALDRLAQQSDRTRSGVMRALLHLAVKSPEVQSKLGNLPTRTRPE